jgi:hypothetical protein
VFSLQREFSPNLIAAAAAAAVAALNKYKQMPQRLAPCKCVCVYEDMVHSAHTNLPSHES